MNRANVTGWLAALLFLLGAVLPLRAEEADDKVSNPHVVIIGINQYADKQIKSRVNAEADATALYDVFTNTTYLGVKPENIKLLLGKEDQKRNAKTANKKNITDAVNWLGTSAKRGDLVIFAFFGQGGSLGERGDRTCYFASDSTLKGRDKDAVPAADIQQAFDKLKSEKVTVILDVNFKGFDAGKESIPEATLGTTPYKEFLGDDGSEEHNPLPGRIIYLATNGLAESVELKDHGLFAQAILDGLTGDADKDGGEADGLVIVDELTTYLNKQIPELMRKHNKVSDDRRRDHFVVTGVKTHFPLTMNPKVYARSRRLLESFRTLAAKDKLDKQLVEEGERLLDRMPKLEALRKLRKEYQYLADGESNLAAFKEKRLAVLDTMKLEPKIARHFSDKVIEATKMVDEEYVNDVNQGELIGWAIRGLYRRLDEKIPEDINDKLNAVKTMKQPELGVLLNDVRMRLGNREDLDKHKDIDIALQRMLAKLDPYTTYIDPEMVERFKIEYRGELTGIGVQIRKDITTDMLQVVTPILGSPSHKAGIKAGDIITTVTRFPPDEDADGKMLQQPEVLSMKGVVLSDAVKKIIGKPNTKVKITIQREGEKKPIDFEITRARIDLESVFGVKRNKDDSWDYMMDAENKIAYIRLGNFARFTARDLTKTVQELRRQGMKGLVLDLRFNPGGLLQSSQTISDLFIDDGAIVSIRRPRKMQEERLTGRSAGSMLDFPMVCLVNGYSASASEIVSACLQDHKRAVIMGERSYGKGSVQTIQDFDGGQIKVTIASFWRPNGKNLNKSSTGGKDNEDWGVLPDKGYELKLDRKEREDLVEYQRNTEIIDHREAKEKKPEFKDRQLDLAQKYLQDQIKNSAKK